MYAGGPTVVQVADWTVLLPEWLNAQTDHFTSLYHFFISSTSIWIVFQSVGAHILGQPKGEKY